MNKIAIDARLYGGENTGDSTYWTGLIDQFILNPFSDLEFLFYVQPENPLLDQSGPGFQVRTISTQNSRWWSMVSLPQAAKHDRAAILHKQYNISPLTKIKRVTTIHDVSFMIGPEWFSQSDRSILTRAIPRTIREADQIITVSKTSQEDIAKYFPLSIGKTTAIYNGPNDKIYPIEKELAKKIVAEKYGLTGPFALTVGTIWPRKNFALAAKAIDLLPPNIDLKLAVTGKSGWGDPIKGSRLVTTGYVELDDLSALYSAASLYIAPSLHEGFGIPLLEAWICGCPVICSAGGALPEVAGDAAEIIPSWNAEDWALCISQLVSDSGKLEQLRNNGYKRTAQFTWKAAAEQTANVYRKVLETP